MDDVTKTPEQIEAEIWQGIDTRQQAIEETLKRKVFPIVVADKDVPGEKVIGFAFEPDLTAQLRLMDKGQEFKSGISIEACSQAMDSLIIKDETDPRILDKSGNALYWKAACFTLSQFLQMGAPELKKK